MLPSTRADDLRQTKAYRRSRSYEDHALLGKSDDFDLGSRSMVMEDQRLVKLYGLLPGKQYFT